MGVSNDPPRSDVPFGEYVPALKKLESRVQAILDRPI